MDPTGSTPRRRAASLEAWLFALALTLSSALLFVLEPMLGKLVLPALGATPAIWTTCMLFFQAALLAGYAYVHATAAWLGPQRQAVVHVTALAIAAATLPVTLDVSGSATSEVGPVTWLLEALARSAGLPFLLVEATAPALQVWFAALRTRGSEDPYFLYAASNFGSLAGLLAYPILVEPQWTLAEQSHLWSFGYGLLVAIVIGCACLLWSSPPPAATVAHDAADADEVGAIRRLRWVALSFAPASLMLGATTFVTTDLAAIPLLWVLPLALYLTTLVLAFSPTRPLHELFASRAVCFVSLPLLVAVLTDASSPAPVLLSLHLLALFLGAGSCHIALAADRPPAARLTEYYLWVSFGGVLGGFCNAILAPLVFRGVTEYPLAIVLVCLLGRGGPRLRPDGRDLAVAAGLAALIAAASLGFRTLGESSRAAQLVVYLVPALICYSFVERPIRFARGLGAIVFVGLAAPLSPSSLIHEERNFFGVLRVSYDRAERFHVLSHGDTIHGRQSLDDENRLEPMSYYHRQGPLGQVFGVVDAASPSVRVAAVGLGAGVVASYARPSDHWTFYEINPGVIAIARNERYFTFLRDCRAREPVIVAGDARLRLREAPAQAYDLIVLDAFGSDSIPIHLVTREAFALYVEKLAPGGLIAAHVSHRLLDLRPVLAAAAADRGLIARVREDAPGEVLARGQDSSRWIVMARGEGDFASIAVDPRWRQLSPTEHVRPWTDDFSNLLGAVDWAALGRQLVDAATR